MKRRDFLLASACLPTAGLNMKGSGSPIQPAGADRSRCLVRDWTFGNARSNATVRTMADLSKDFRFRYIYDGGKLDSLPTYWSVHRDYPEGDPRSLHVFSADALTLKARVPPGGGLHRGGIESGMLRALLPVTPGMFVEMRAKLPRGLGVWPAFWLNPGVENKDGTFSALPWPPEIDIFEFFVWQGRDRPTLMESHTQDEGHPDRYGGNKDLFTLYGSHGYDPGIDFSADFHVFGLDWRDGAPAWYVDGKRVKQTTYQWNAPPAHILITNQIGMTLAGVDLKGMQANEKDWDYTVDYVRVWE